MAEFKVGDVVRLKSGGPKMTISHIYGDQKDDVSCVWFTKSSDGDEVAKYYDFKTDMIEIAT